MSSKAALRARLVVATFNPGKFAEIRQILADANVELCSLRDLPPLRFPDEGDDYLENAAAKARAVASQLQEIAVADDSGLEVDALAGAPGPHSARYGGPELDDSGRVQRLLCELCDTPVAARGARFVCAAALATPAGELLTVRRECRGSIALAARGEAGFGYDPVFLVEGGGRVMAELSAQQKNRISHRAQAFRALWHQWGGTMRPPFPSG